MAECNYGIYLYPERYQEIYCNAKGNNNRSFVCKNGYEREGGKDGKDDPIIITDDPTSSKNCFANKKCVPVKDIKIPTIIRPSGGNIKQCTLDKPYKSGQTYTKKDLKSLKTCLELNRKADVDAKCIGPCKMKPYEGDWLVTTTSHTAQGTTLSPTYNVISNEEKIELYEDKLDAIKKKPGLCYKKNDKKQLVKSNEARDCITNLTKYTYDNIKKNIPELKGSSKTKVEKGMNISPNKGEQWYIGYNLHKPDNKIIGTTLDKFLKPSTSNYLNNSSKDDLKDLELKCDSNAYYTSKENNHHKFVDTKGPKLDLFGCEMNRCKFSGSWKTVLDLNPGEKCLNDMSQVTKKSDLTGTPAIDPIDPNLLNFNCDICPLLETEQECNKNNKDKDGKCYWFQSEGKGESKCMNKCGARKTKGQCEQFYYDNNVIRPNSLYEFDGKDNKCKWYPDYNNIDDSESSTFGTCRDSNIGNPACINKTTKDTGDCNITIPGKNNKIKGTIKKISGNPYCIPNKDYFKGAYCKEHYINTFEENCYNEINTENCVKKTQEAKCVSDASLLHTNKGKVNYKTDRMCAKYNEINCKKEFGCIYIPENKKLWKSKSIYELMKNQNQNQKLKDMCKPLKAQIPNNYDINLLEEEGKSTSDYRDDHDKEPPYITSKYLCDICHIRNKDINSVKFTNKLFKLGSESKQEYCEKGIDKGSPNNNKPCQWLKGPGNKGTCISHCQASIKDNFPETKDYNKFKESLNGMKETCIKTRQYVDAKIHSIEFPKYRNGLEDPSNYYKELYCSWDGLECHNSIPCKEAQRIRCEDLGYDWYKGTIADISNQRLKNNQEPINLSDLAPIRHTGDGKPIKSDQDGICIFPNMKATFKGTRGEYVINGGYARKQGILLKWREYGTGWWEDNTLYKRKVKTKSPVDIAKNNTSYYLGEHMIFIQFEVDEGDTPEKVMNAINDKIRSYQYYALNGEFVVWAKDIYDWTTDTNNGYQKVFNLKKTVPDQDEEILKYFCGYNYYCKNATNAKNGGKPVTLTSKPFNDVNDYDGFDNKQWHDIFMCNVIYDLRGTIPLIPVINGRGLIDIKEFQIDNSTGNILFSINGAGQPISTYGYGSINYDTRFEFVKFIDASIFKEPWDPKKTDLNLFILNKYDYKTKGKQPLWKPDDKVLAKAPSPMDEWKKAIVVKSLGGGEYTLKWDDGLSIQGEKQTQLSAENIRNRQEKSKSLPAKFYYGTELPQTIASGYGNLYDYHISGEDEYTYDVIDIENILQRNSVSSVNDGTVQVITKTTGKSILKSIINKFKKKQTAVTTDTADKTAITTDIYWNNTSENHQYALFDELYNILQEDDDLNSTNKTTINLNPLLKCIRNNKQNTTLGTGSLENWKIAKTLLTKTNIPSYQTINLLTSTPFLKLLYQYKGDEIQNLSKGWGEKNLSKSDNIQPKEILKAALWSMTRNTHPYFGDLLYNPYSTDTTSKKLPYIGGGRNSAYDPSPRKSRSMNSEYQTHLLGPFNQKTSKSEYIIDWDRIMTYAGGNKNKIIRSKKLLNPDPRTTKGWKGWTKPSEIKAILEINDKKNTDKNRSYYFKKTYINYINLTPNNDIFGYGNGRKISKAFFKKVYNIKDTSDDDYYVPGKWLYPDIQGNWIITRRTTNPSKKIKYNINSFRPTETGSELIKLRRLFYSVQGVPKMYGGWKFTYDPILDINGQTKWTGNDIKHRLKFQKTLCSWMDQKLDGKVGKYTTINLVCQNRDRPYNKNFTVTAAENFWKKHQNDKKSTWTLASMPGIANNWCWSRRSRGHTHTHNAPPRTIKAVNTNERSLKSYLHNSGVEVEQRTNLKRIGYKWDQAMVKKVFNEKTGWYGKLQLGTDNNTKDFSTFKKRWDFVYNTWGCSDYTKRTNPPGWRKGNMTINNRSTRFDPKNQKLLLDINDNNYTKTLSNKQIIDNIGSVKPSQSSNYPSWVITKNDNDKCINLLSYVPNTLNNTINTIDINNCALPLLTTKEKNTTAPNGLIDNLHRFTEGNEGLVRDVCPKICGVPDNETPLLPNVKGVSLISKRAAFTINAETIPPMGSEKTLIGLFSKDGKETVMYLLYPSNTWKQGKANKDRRLNDTGEDGMFCTNSFNMAFASSGILERGATNDSGCIIGVETTEGKTKEKTGRLKNLQIKNIAQKLPNENNLFSEVKKKNKNNNYVKENFECIEAIFNRIESDVCSSIMVDKAKDKGKKMYECLQNSTYVTNKCDTAGGYNSTSHTPINVISKIYSTDNVTHSSPWMHLGAILKPADNTPSKYEQNPYDDKGENCEVGEVGKEKQFIKINPSQDYEFYKPYRNNRSHIFRPAGKNEKYEYGCINNDIMNIDSSYFKLNCNTNTSYSINRDKYRMINFIIHHSNNRLNISDRTKLAIMDEEELLRKAVELGIDMNELNKYTRPKLVTNVVDVWNPNMYGKKVGGFEIWNDLQQKYLNITTNPKNPNKPKLGLKTWNYVGCSLDFNDSDSSSSFNICKDRYPGLCQYHKSKCNSTNPEVKKNFRLDCPETCNVQFKNMDEFKHHQTGDLSICTTRGRCKWSEDQNDANLLPLCDKKYSREYGDNDKCKNFKNLSVGTCTKGKNNNICMEHKCHSMNGCVYVKPGISNCYIPKKVINNVSASECIKKHKGRWSGPSDAVGSCIITDYYDDNPNIKEKDCRILGGVWSPTKKADCIFNALSWTPLEDPCGLPYNNNCNNIKDRNECNQSSFCTYSDSQKMCNNSTFEKLSTAQKKRFELSNKGTFKPLTIKNIKPECTDCNDKKIKGKKTDKKTDKTPDAFKLLLDTSISFDIKKRDYIKIDTIDDSDMCSPILSGYSKVLDVGPGGSYIIIKGPNTAYVLPKKDQMRNEYKIGKCAITKHYRINDLEHPDKTEKKCVNNVEGSCTFVDSNVFEDINTTSCKSCSLINDREKCINTNKYSECGWGEVRDICEAIGDIGECNDMYVEGCYWDKNKEMCTLNPVKNDDGDLSRQSEGCMKCSDIKHSGLCNSLSNCFYNRKVKGEKGECQSCSSIVPDDDDDEKVKAANKCMNYDVTGGKCQWRKDASEPDADARCRNSYLYPLITDWIEYNKLYLACLVGCIYLLIKLPIDKIPVMPLKILGYIVQIVLIFVTIPGLSVLIVRADGTNGRKQYIDPTIDVNNPGITDFIYDQNRTGAKWPATIYDDEWDNFIMDHSLFRKPVELEIHPTDLDWSKFFIWDNISRWNNFVNSMGDNIFTLLIVTGIIAFTGIYLIGLTLDDDGVPPKTTVYIIIGCVLFTIYLRHIINSRKDHLAKIPGVYKGNTRELKSPIEKGEGYGLTQLLYSLPGSNCADITDQKNCTNDCHWKQQSNTENCKQYDNKIDCNVTNGKCKWKDTRTIVDRVKMKSKGTCEKITGRCESTYKVCPYGCGKVVSNKFMPCPDKRSIFAFTGSMDPNPKKTYLDYNNNKGLFKTKDEYICPPNDNHTRYPYDLLCKPLDKCVHDSYVDKGKGTTIQPKDYDATDKICKDFYNKHGICDTNKLRKDGKSISAKYKKDLMFGKGDDIREIDCKSWECISKDDTIISKCNTKTTRDACKSYTDKDGKPLCKIKDKSDIKDNCPFDLSYTKQIDVDEFEGRHPIKLWKTIYDKISGCADEPKKKIIGKDGKAVDNPDYLDELEKHKACTTKRRLSESREREWENQYRYEIVNQNYGRDKSYE